MRPTRRLSLKTALFDFAFFVFAAGYLPIFLKKLSQAASKTDLIKQRFGILSEELRGRWRGKTVLWLHAVSVGEVMAAKPLLKGLCDNRPDVHVVLTTVTPTGQKIAKGLESARLTACYFPFDFSGVVRRFLKAVQPKTLLLMETEIWPNLLTAARELEIPAGIVNARLSQKSFRRYHQLGFLIRPVLQGLDFVLTQTEEDRDRFQKLGIPSNRVQVMGNIKFDLLPDAGLEIHSQQVLRKKWGLESEDLVWIAGSTHPGEEALLLRVFQALRPQFPRLKLVLAPRHVERSAQVVREAARNGLRTVTSSVLADFDVLVLDQLGILRHLYGVADVVFLGGSFASRGGQNPIEAAVFKRPILHGPFVFNFEQVYRLLDESGGALAVKNESHLKNHLERLLTHAEERETRGRQAFEKVMACRGAADRCLAWLRDYFGPRLSEKKTHVESPTQFCSPACS